MLRCGWKGDGNCRNSVNSSGLEPVTFGLVAERQTHLSYRVPLPTDYTNIMVHSDNSMKHINEEEL
jgi:hypothetical protein